MLETLRPRPQPARPGSILVLFLVAALAGLTVFGGIAAGCRKGPDRLVLGFVAPPGEAGPGQLPEKPVETLSQLLGQALETRVDVFAFPSSGELVQALGGGQVDVAVFSPYAYVAAHDSSGAQLLLRATVGGKDGLGSEILVLADGGPSTLADLKGKSFAFVDPVSPSGYLFPAAYLVQNGIVPAQDLAKAVFAGDQVAAIQALLDGKVQAAACEEGARQLARLRIPDLDSRVTVIARTPAVPGLTVAVRPGIDAELADRVKQAFLAVTGEGDGLVAWKTITGTDGLKEAQNSDYDVVRQMAETLGLDIEVLAAN